MRKNEPPTQNLPSHVPPSAQKTTEGMGGDVMLFDANSMQGIKVIPAHQAPLSCIAMNNEGTLLATASEKGTVIRVFRLPSAEKLYQFRRGSMPARIHCMSFNATSTLLCVSSATETVHIFKLTPQEAAATDGNGDMSPQHARSPLPTNPVSRSRTRSSSPSAASDQADSATLDASATDGSASSRVRNAGFMSMMRRTSQNVSTSFVSRAAGYLPSAVTEIWEPSRDFAWVKTPRSRSGQPVKTVVAMAGSAPQVMLATSDGDFIVYSIDLERGGEGTILRHDSVREMSDSHTGMYAE